MNISSEREKMRHLGMVIIGMIFAAYGIITMRQNILSGLPFSYNGALFAVLTRFVIPIITIYNMLRAKTQDLTDERIKRANNKAIQYAFWTYVLGSILLIILNTLFQLNVDFAFLKAALILACINLWIILRYYFDKKGE